MARPEISIIIPALNEETNIPLIFGRISTILQRESFEVIFVDDGSTDSSFKVIESLASADNRAKGISFSRNFGHQSALKAGLDTVSGNCAISMDCDLEHPPEYLLQMIQFWREGADVVITQRKVSIKLSLFKRLSSKVFYRALRYISDIPIESGTADFRLLDKKVISACKAITENDLFWRGIIPWLGFRTKVISYEQAQRQHGESKYTLSRMIKLSLAGITSFSVRPLYLSLYLGTMFSCLSICYLLYALYVKFFTNETVSGWASVIASVLLIGGVQLLILGVMGIYLGKLFIQTKGRPQYIIRETVGLSSN